MITPAFLLILVPIAVYILAREDFANGKYIFYKSRILAITFILILLTPAGLGSTFSVPEAFAENQIKQIIKIAGLYPADTGSVDFVIDPPLTNIDKSFVIYTVRHTGENDASDTIKSIEILDINTIRLKGEAPPPPTGINPVEFVAYVIEYQGEIDVQHLQESLAASAGSQSFTMGSVNTTNSMIVSRGQHLNTSATAVGNNDFLRIDILDSTTWRVNIDTAPDTPQGSLVSVIDWNMTDVSVQSGLFTMENPSFTGEIIGGTDFTAIDPTRTMFLFTYTSDGASTEPNDDLMIRGSLTDGGDIRFFRDDDDSELLVAWQLIEFPADFIKIKHFNSTLLNAVLSIDVTVPEIQDFDKTIAMSHGGSPFGWSTGSGSNDGEIDGGIDRSQSTLLVTNNTQVTISREDSTAFTEIGWQLIEFLEADEAQNAQGTNTLRQVIKIEDTYTGATAFQDFTISPSLLTVNNTILFMSIEDASLDTADVSERLKRFGIVDTSTLRIHGSNDPLSTNTPINFTAYLVEFDQSSPIFVQRDQVQYSNGITDDELVMHMSPVNQSGSHIQYNAWTSTSGDTSVGQEEFARVRIINDTTWGYDVEQPSDDEESVAVVNIVDWNQNSISVQSGQASLTGTTLSVSPSTDVIRNQTILLVSHKTSNSEFEDEPDDSALFAHLDGSSPPDMVFERIDSADPALLINWQLISFPSDFANIQHLTHLQAIATDNDTATITSVGNFSNSIAIGTSMSPMGFSNGKASKSDTDQFGEAHGKITLENDTTVRFERGLSTGSWELGYQVVEFLTGGGDLDVTIPNATNNVTVTDDTTVIDVIKGLPAATPPFLFFNSSIPNVLNFTDFFTEVSDSGMIGEDITLDNQRPVRVVIANVSGTSTNGTLTMKVFTNVTLDVSTLGDAVLEATSDSFDLSTFDISTNQTLQFNFTSAPFITGSAFGLEMAGMNGTINLPIDQANAGGRCFEVKDLVPVANFSKGPKDTKCEQFAFEVYVSNSTSDVVNATDVHILDTIKVLGTDISAGATSACSAGIGTSFLKACYTFDTADISNDTATNSGTLGTLADAEYFSDSIKSPFVINATGIINQAVLQNGTNDDGTPFAPGRTQGEIRLVNSSNISEFNFIHTQTGSNLTSINFWIFGDVDGAAEYPLITSMSQNAGEDSGMNLHTRGADMCLNLGVNGSFVVNNSCVIGGPIPADDGQWHMVTLLMDKGNTTSFAKIYIDGSSIGTINGNTFPTDIEDSFRELKIGGTEFASSRVETTWFVDDFAIWNGYQLTDSDIDTLFNVAGEAGALVTVTEAKILNTTKVLNDIDTGGGNSLNGIDNSTAPNTGSFGSNATGFYFDDDVLSPFVVNETGIVNEAVIQNGTASLDSQGEIRFGNDTNKSQWDFLHTANTGSNITSINFWINGDVDGSPNYPMLSNLDRNIESNGINIFTSIGGLPPSDMCISLEEGNVGILTGDPSGCLDETVGIPQDDGQWHMVTVLLNKGNDDGILPYATICINGTGNCDTLTAANPHTGTGSTAVDPLTIGDDTDDGGQSPVENTFNVDEVIIWNGYNLTNADIDNMWNSGVGASGSSIQPSFQVLNVNFDLQAGSGNNTGVIVTDSVSTLLTAPLEITLNVTNNNVNVTDAKILDTNKVLNDIGTGSGGSLNGIDNSTATNLGTFGTNATARYFIPATNTTSIDLVVNASGIINEAVFQDGDVDGTNRAEIRLGTDADRSQWNFIHQPNVGFNKTSINFWMNGDVVGGADYPILDSIAPVADVGTLTGFTIFTQSGSTGVRIYNEDSLPLADSFVGQEPPDDGQWHMITVTMDKGNLTGTWGLICIDGSSNCDTLDLGTKVFGTPMTANSTLSIGSRNDAEGNLVENGFNVDDLTIWQDHILTTSEIASLYNSGNGSSAGSSGESIEVAKQVGHWNFDLSGGAGGGVTVTDSIVTLLTPAGTNSTITLNGTENNANVTDAHILNPNKVLNDINTTPSGGGGTITNSGSPSEDSIPYIQTWDGDYDIRTALSGVSNSSAYIGVRSPGNFDSLNITSISVLPANPGSLIPDSAGHFMTGVILSNVTATNNFEDVVIEGVSTNSIDLGLLSDPANSFTTFFFDPPVTITNDTGEIFLGFNYSTNGVTAPSLATSASYSTVQSGTCTFVEHGIGNSWSTDCSALPITNIQMEVMDQLDSPLPNFTISGGDLVTDKLLVYHTFDTAQEITIDGTNFDASGNAGTYGNRATAVTSMDGGIIQSDVNTVNPKLGDGSILVDNPTDHEVLLSSLENYGVTAPNQDWTFMTNTKAEDWGMSFWLRCDDCGTIGESGSIFNMMADGEDYGIRIVLNGTNDTIEVDMANDDGLFVSGLSSGVSLGVDSWTHVGLTFDKDELDVGDADNGTVILYINGTQVANATAIDYSSGNGKRNNVPAIGERVSSQTKWVTRTAEDFTFAMDDLCIWGPEFGGGGYLPTATNMTFIYNGGAGNTCIAEVGGGGANEGGVLTSDSVVTLLAGSLNVTISNATNNVNVTDAKILDTNKVLNDTGGGGGNVTTFANAGTLGTAADAEYFISDVGSQNFVLNTTAVLNGGVFQSGLATQGEQGEIRFGNDTNKSQWEFLQRANVGSNITSINLWINGDLVGSPHYPIFETHTNSNPTNGFSYDQGDNGNTFLRIEEGGTQHGKTWTTDVPDDGQWHMATIIFDKNAAASTWTQYIDGVVSGSIGSSGGIFAGGGGALVKTLTLGGTESASGNAVTENGYSVDDLSIWNGYALTGTDVTNLYNSGVGSAGSGIAPGSLVLYHSFDTGSGVIVTDSVSTLLSVPLEIILNGTENNVNVTDAKILDTNKVISDTDTGFNTTSLMAYYHLDDVHDNPDDCTNELFTELGDTANCFTVVQLQNVTGLFGNAINFTTGIMIMDTNSSNGGFCPNNSCVWDFNIGDNVGTVTYNWWAKMKDSDSSALVFFDTQLPSVNDEDGISVIFDHSFGNNTITYEFQRGGTITLTRTSAQGFTVFDNDFHMYTIVHERGAGADRNVTFFVDGVLHSQHSSVNLSCPDRGIDTDNFCFNDTAPDFKASGTNGIVILDELSFWDRNVTSTELLTLYNGGAGLLITSGGAGTNNTGVIVTDSVVVALLQDVVISNATNNANVTDAHILNTTKVLNDINTSGGTGFDLTDLEIYYKMDGTSMFNELVSNLGSQGKGNQVSVIGTPTFQVAGIINNGIEADASTDGVLTGNFTGTDLNFLLDTNGRSSVNFWLFHDFDGNDRQYIFSTTDSLTDDGCTMDFNGILQAMQLECFPNAAGTGVMIGGLSATNSWVLDNDWHMWTVTMNHTSGGLQKFYLDGVQIGGQGGTTWTPRVFDTNPNDISMFQRKNAPIDKSTEMPMDEFSLWSKILTPTEISTLYNNGTGFELGARTYPDPVLYLDFEDQNLNAELITNLGTYGSAADCVVKHQVSGNMSATDILNSTGLLGNSLIINGTLFPAANTGTKFACGLEDDSNKDTLWRFLHTNDKTSPSNLGSNLTSINLWVLGDFNKGDALDRKHIVDTSLALSGSNGIEFQARDPDRLVAHIQEGTGANIFNVGVGTTAIPDDGQFHMITMLLNKTEPNGNFPMRLCLDATSCVDIPYLGGQTFDGSSTVTDRKLTVGSNEFSSAVTNLDFNIDELAVWKDHYLTATELAFLYNGGVGNTVLVANVTGGNEGGVLVTDSVVAQLTAGLNSTISSATNFVNVTDAHILDTIKVLNDTDTSGLPPNTELQFYYKFNATAPMINEPFTVIGSKGDITNQSGVTQGTGLFGEANGAHRYGGVAFEESNNGITPSDLAFTNVNATGKFASYNYWSNGTVACGSGNGCTLFDTRRLNDGTGGIGLSDGPFGIQYQFETQALNLGAYIRDGTWHMYTLIHNGTDNFVYNYRDAVFQTKSELFIATLTEPLETQITIGNDNRQSVPLHITNWSNSADEFSIWSTDLTQNQMEILYNNGTGFEITATGGGGGNNTGVIVTDTVNAFISSVNNTEIIDDNVNMTDTVQIAATFNQTVGTVDNNVNVTDSVTIINSKNATVPSGINTAIITDSIVLNFTKFLDDESAISDNVTLNNVTAPPVTPPPTGGGSSGGGGVPTFLGTDPLSASLTGISLTLSKPEHTLSTEIIVNPLFSSVSELGTVILNWDQQEPIQVTGISVPEQFEGFVEFTARTDQTLEFAGAKANPEDTFSTGILVYEAKIPAFALGVTQDTNPFGAAVEFFTFIQLVFTNQYTIPVTVDAIHDGKPFQFTGEIVINHIKEVRWVVIALTIAFGVFLAVWGKRYFSATTPSKTGSFRKSLDKARRATVNKQKPGSFRKSLEQQRRADRIKLKRK